MVERRCGVARADYLRVLQSSAVARGCAAILDHHAGHLCNDRAGGRLSIPDLATTGTTVSARRRDIAPRHVRHLSGARLLLVRDDSRPPELRAPRMASSRGRMVETPKRQHGAHL